MLTCDSCERWWCFSPTQHSRMAAMGGRPLPGSVGSRLPLQIKGPQVALVGNGAGHSLRQLGCTARMK